MDSSYLMHQYSNLPEIKISINPFFERFIVCDNEIMIDKQNYNITKPLRHSHNSWGATVGVN